MATSVGRTDEREPQSNWGNVTLSYKASACNSEGPQRSQFSGERGLMILVSLRKEYL